MQDLEWAATCAHVPVRSREWAVQALLDGQLPPNFQIPQLMAVEEDTQYARILYIWCHDFIKKLFCQDIFKICYRHCRSSDGE